MEEGRWKQLPCTLWGRREKVDDIRVVTDERATKKAIMERLTWLVKGAKVGDRLLFHFSGHGSQVRDRNTGRFF